MESNIDIYSFIPLLRIIFFKESHEPVLIKTAYGLDQYYLQFNS